MNVKISGSHTGPERMVPSARARAVWLHWFISSPLPLDVLPLEITKPEQLPRLVKLSVAIREAIWGAPAGPSSGNEPADKYSVDDTNAIPKAIQQQATHAIPTIQFQQEVSCTLSFVPFVPCSPSSKYSNGHYAQLMEVKAPGVFIKRENYTREGTGTGAGGTYEDISHLDGSLQQRSSFVLPTSSLPQSAPCALSLVRVSILELCRIVGVHYTQTGLETFPCTR